MRMNGQWIRTPTGVMLPIINAEVRASDGTWRSAPFLIDTGAEVSVFRYDLLYELQLDPEMDNSLSLSGLGGGSTSICVSTTLRIDRDDGVPVQFKGLYQGLTDPIGLDISILGRDILGHFALIVDRPGLVVALVAGQHGYRIVPNP
jgi:hypothetical protein